MFVRFVSDEKKEFIKGSEQSLKSQQNKLQKTHRNRNPKYKKSATKQRKRVWKN